MSRRLYLTVSLLSFISLLIIIHSLSNMDHTVIPQLIFWILLASFFESLPIYFTKDRAVSVTFVILLASQLSHGIYFTTVVAAFSSILVFIKNTDGTYKHLFNIPLYKTLINLSNFTISMFSAGLLYNYLLESYTVFSNMTALVFLVIIFIITVFLFNSLIMTLYAVLMVGCPFIKTWISGTLWALPNFIAISPIGFFIYKLYQLPSGSVYILLLLGPLLLARYSFKLYLDSKEQYYKIIKTLTAAIEAKDKYTEGHSRRVEDYAERIALKLKFSPNRIDSIKVAALLHDIGKIGIEDSILAKPTRLSQDEWSKIQQHPIIGMKILEEVSFPKQVKDAILHHHEKYNGGGYPDGLKGDQVSTDAYILSAADAYDAMTSDRPYRKALSKETAISILNSEKGSQFHPEIADILISILLEEGKTTDKTPDEEAEGNYAAI